VHLDEYLPTYDVASRHAVDIRVSPQKAYAAVLACDLRSSLIARLLFAMRGMSADAAGSVLEHVERLGFIRLREDPPREIVMGLVGRFWTPRGDLQRLSSYDFVSFERPGFAKAAWNFLVDPLSDGSVRVSTETRVLCLDASARRKFALYWTVIGPFSGLIRREMLKEIQQRANAQG
jgi:hypothetical protein